MARCLTGRYGIYIHSYGVPSDLICCFLHIIIIRCHLKSRASHRRVGASPGSGRMNTHTHIYIYIYTYTYTYTYVSHIYIPHSTPDITHTHNFLLYNTVCVGTVVAYTCTSWCLCDDDAIGHRMDTQSTSTGIGRTQPIEILCVQSVSGIA